MNTLELTSQAREKVGARSAELARKEGLIPAVIYGGDGIHHITVDAVEAGRAIFTDKFYQVNITVDGKSVPCIVKDLDLHPVTSNIIHIDYQELVPGKKVKIDVPVRTYGTAKGVLAGGKLETSLRKLTVKLDAGKLIDEVTVNIENLEMGKSVKVKDIDANAGVEVMNSPGNPIAQVIVPRSMRSEASKSGDLEATVESEEASTEETQEAEA
ncbi:MAG TPA: 50S ribosomal protein L25 [Bacteroidetes bacterium]|nr:50S ribosomal protein L25 [Bacteroidota bacterium]|tara:strand:+ start:841 stop:1479 length:639 start_codon:yes stop_codon:yes gene_type:complete